MKRLFSLIAVAVLCFLLCVPAFATDAEIPPVPEFSDEMKSQIAEHDLKVLLCYLQDTQPRFVCVLLPSSDEYYLFGSSTICSRSVPSGGFQHGLYRYGLDLGVWEVLVAFPSGYYGVSLSEPFVCIPEASTVTLYNSDGTVFFSPAPPPLAEQLQTQAGELTQTQVTETLNFLVPLGIGLMALLISSVLLRRVFRTFL